LAGSEDVSTQTPLHTWSSLGGQHAPGGVRQASPAGQTTPQPPQSSMDPM